MLTPHQPSRTDPGDLSDYTPQQLLTRLFAAMELFSRTERVTAVDRKLAGQAVLNTLSEIHQQGYKVTKHRDGTVHLFQADKVEMERSLGAIETLTPKQLQEHIYFYLTDQHVIWTRKGWKSMAGDYLRATMLLNNMWRVRAVHMESRKLGVE